PPGGPARRAGGPTATEASPATVLAASTPAVPAPAASAPPAPASAPVGLIGVVAWPLAKRAIPILAVAGVVVLAVYLAVRASTG
ncbi:carbon monoxide dehydrogenase, partial [Frankia sp. CN7]|nr:carbon monoxide dehydrogenase [Frankia nepalensis]